MTKGTVKKSIAVLGVTAVLAGGIVFNGIQEAKIDPITFNGQSIDYPYTDDNAGETLLIHTDQSTYSSWDSTYVNFAVKNVSGSDSNTDIQFLAAGSEGVTAIEEFKPHTPYIVTVDDFDTKDTCEETIAPGTLKATTTCYKKKIGSHEVTKFKDEWGEVLGSAPKNLDIGSKSEPVKFVPKKQIAYLIHDGETKYFRAKLNFNAKSTGEFYIKAKGDNGAFGVLDPFYSSSWLYRIPITIDDAKVPTTDQTNFPVEVDITNASLAAGAQSSGNDILFTSADGTTKLDHEIEVYTSATGRLTAWVRVPTLKHDTTGDTAIYMYYGNPGASNQQSVNATWNSSFKGVWHLPNGSSLTANDSTSGGFNGTVSGPTATAGKVDGGVNFAGGSDVITASFTAFAKPMTIQGWSNATLSGAGVSMTLVQSDPYNANPGFLVYLNYGGGAIGPVVEFYDQAGGPSDFNGLTSWPNDGAFHSWAISVDGSGNRAVFVDGVAKTVVNNGGTPAPNTTTAIKIGNGFLAHTGKMDEIRISNVALDSTWMTTEYNNESATSTFYTIGAEEVNTVTTAASAVFNSQGQINVTGQLKI